jgi:GAF domain-containing protein
MKIKHKERENMDVGASKAAKIILGGIDRRLIRPAALLMRLSGWLLVLLVAYMSFFEILSDKEYRNLYLWIALYAVYLLSLEVLRKYSSEVYEKSWFRTVRIVINLIMISVLVSLAPFERHLLIFAYILPIFATVAYFAENDRVKVGVLILAIIGIYVGDLIFSNGPKLSLVHFAIYSFVLAAVTFAFEILRRRINLLPGRMTELARELHKTLDLQQLMSEILMNACEITVAQRGLIIIINPRTKRYVGHSLYNFEMRSDGSIENLARKCFVLVHGQAYENPDIGSAFNNQSIYDEFFISPPRSIMAEPLYTRSGQVMGVINVAHNNANRFDKISRNLLKQFAFLVSNAIENCFEHREVKLREAKSREAGERFVSAASEDQAVHTLIEEVRQQIPHAEKLTLHQFLIKGDNLLPVHSYSLEVTPRIFVWSSPMPGNVISDFRLGYGVAGHALELRDTILVPDVDQHPWFVKLDSSQNIKSLLVAPLFDPQGNELYGTISLESSQLSSFNLEDESTLTYLANQASRVIAKVRDFEVWREQGGTFRQILEQIQAYDLSAKEAEILQQIADSATKLLGFQIARIRILNARDQLVTKGVSGVPEKTRKRLMEVDLPYSEILPFLNEKIKVESSYLIRHGNPAWEQLVDKYFHVPKEKMYKSQGWHSYDALITPLLDSSGTTLGILTLDLPNTGSEPNQQLLESIGLFASSAGWMLELSRFQKRLEEEQHRTQSFIDTISQELAKGRDLATICEVVVQVGAKLLSAEGCSLHLLRGNYIELTHSNYLADTDLISRRKPISTRPKAGLTSWVASTGEVLRLNNEKFKEHNAWAQDDEHLQYLPSKTCQSVLLAPVKDKAEKVIGVLTLENKMTRTGPKDFDENDQERLVSLANEFARALEMIGLYEDMKEWERIELADDLHDLINWYHSGVVLWIEALEVWLKRGDEDKIRELLPQLHAHAYTTVFELKTLHTNMLQNSFEADNLKLAISETMSAWTKRVTPKYKEGMRINLVCPDNLEIPVGLRNTMVRIASLAFSNAVLHSGIIENPKVEVSVSVRQEGNTIVLAVIDNGRGIDFTETPKGFGFDRMEQLTNKIKAWEGVSSDLQIETEINMGTKVFLRLKLDGKVH